MRRLRLFFLQVTNAGFTVTAVCSWGFVRRAWGENQDDSLSMGAVGGCEGATELGSRVQLGKDPTLSLKSPCCTISGTIFFNIDRHLEFCGASLKKCSEVTHNSLIFCYTSVTSFKCSKISLSLDLLSPYQEPPIETADLVQKKSVNLDLTDAELLIIVSEVEPKCN